MGYGYKHLVEGYHQVLIEHFIFTLMIVPTATTIALLLLIFITPSCGYVSSLRVFFTLREPLPSLDHSQRSQQSNRLNLAAINDPVAQLLLASTSEAERKLAEVEVERKLEKVELERKLEKVELERKLKVERNLNDVEVDRNLNEVEVERKQGEKSIISCILIHIVDGSDI